MVHTIHRSKGNTHYMEKKDLTIEELKEFDSWCKHGIKNYSNFPVGRTDKLSPNITAEFIQYKLGWSYYDALESEYNNDSPKWEEQIKRYWLDNN